MQFGKVLFAISALAVTALGETTSSLSATLTSTTRISIASGCSLEDFTATAQSNLDELSDCEAVRGDIHIAGSLGSAAIANVKAIYGSLIVKNATSLVSLTADSLTTITEQLALSELTILDTLSFAQLTSVGSIYFVTLPALEETGFHTGVSDTESVYISDTALTNLDGIVATDVDVFNVNNNFNLDTVDSHLETVSSALEVSFNSDDVEVSFDNLLWANNITFRNVASVSLNNLTTVNASLGFIESGFQKLSFPGITRVGGSFSIVDNDDLEEIDFSNVESIGGGLIIANNSKLTDFSEWEDLQTVGGALVLEGSFDNGSFPSLRAVRGAFSLESDGDISCDDFSDIRGDTAGEYECSAASFSTSASAQSSSSSTSTSGSSTHTGSSTATSSSSEDAGVALAPASLFTLLASIVLGFL
ncbi:hypothetical protein LJB42_004310 [Komagataella kurtzmanii]|nr:hypothetical protein LJB42_004310 [Komagataella kurtzmanii]